MKESNELFELCKQVYEATGWDGTDKCRAYLKNPYVDVWGWETIPCHEDNIEDVDEWHPLYTSDYLLEKLPRHSSEDIFSGTQVISISDTAWAARCDGGIKNHSTVYHWGVSDTPLKALLKLTLKLHEEGLL